SRKRSSKSAKRCRRRHGDVPASSSKRLSEKREGPMQSIHVNVDGTLHHLIRWGSIPDNDWDLMVLQFTPEECHLYVPPLYWKTERGKAVKALLRAQSDEL